MICHIHAKQFAYNISFNPPNNLINWILFLFIREETSIGEISNVLEVIRKRNYIGRSPNQI